MPGLLTVNIPLPWLQPEFTQLSCHGWEQTELKIKMSCTEGVGQLSEAFHEDQADSDTGSTRRSEAVGPS